MSDNVRMSGMHCARADTQPRVRMRMRTPRPSAGRLHVRTTAGTLWNVYPMYDYAHALTDAIEGVTHSLCSLEFENHRELYDWVVRECDVPSTPRQIEFSRLNLQYTVPPPPPPSPPPPLRSIATSSSSTTTPIHHRHSLRLRPTCSARCSRSVG